VSTLRRRVVLLAALASILVAIACPAPALSHAELVSSDPANGAAVAAGFAGPIVLTYSEGLRSGSHAELLAAGGAKAADATVDAANPTRMVLALAGPLAAGTWTIQWTSVAADRDVERGQVSFTVAAATPSPTAVPTLPPTAAPTASARPPTAVPGASPTAVSPNPSPTPAPAPTSVGEVVVPILAALALVAIAGLLLLRRRGGAG
jgi:MYXO-CTERM domain-containing protein